MEDYVIVDSVLQAMHMSKYKKKAKHLKKYQLTSSSFGKSIQNSTISYDLPYSNYIRNRISITPNSSSYTDRKQTNNYINNMNNSTGMGNGSSVQKQNKKNHKIKMKFILQENQKIKQKQTQNGCKNNHVNYQSFSQFFTKRLIQPKSSRQFTTNRAVNLVKTPQIAKGVFYDTKIQFIRKKSPKCIILPQRKSKDQQKQQYLVKKSVPVINITKLIRQQWQQQKKQRKAQCKTSSTMNNNRTITRNQVKKIQQQLKNKQNQQRYLKSAISQRQTTNNYTYNKNNDYFDSLNSDININKAILPLSKNQINNKTSSIMNKYGVDASKCYIKFVNN